MLSCPIHRFAVSLQANLAVTHRAAAVARVPCGPTVEERKNDLRGARIKSVIARPAVEFGAPVLIDGQGVISRVTEQQAEARGGIIAAAAVKFGSTSRSTRERVVPRITIDDVGGNTGDSVVWHGAAAKSIRRGARRIPSRNLSSINPAMPHCPGSN
jgi:hypothetical protein